MRSEQYHRSVDQGGDTPGDEEKQNEHEDQANGHRYCLASSCAPTRKSVEEGTETQRPPPGGLGSRTWTTLTVPALVRLSDQMVCIL